VNSFKKILSLSLFAAIASVLALYSVYTNTGVDAKGDKYLLSQPQRVSDYYPVNERNAVKLSVASAVHVISATDISNLVSLSSGTYIKYRNKFYILTTSHGIIGECNEIAIVYFDNYTGCKSFVVNNKSLDYVLIEIDEIDYRTPVRMSSDVSKNALKYKLMDKAYYTGYPNSAGPLTFGGTVSGFDNFGYIYLHSYAWSGSSGAGVFDSRGKLIGMVMAIDVGTSEYGVDVLEDIIVVIPIDMIDWAPVYFPKDKTNE